MPCSRLPTAGTFLWIDRLSRPYHDRKGRRQGLMAVNGRPAGRRTEHGRETGTRSARAWRGASVARMGCGAVLHGGDAGAGRGRRRRSQGGTPGRKAGPAAGRHYSQPRRQTRKPALAAAPFRSGRPGTRGSGRRPTGQKKPAGDSSPGRRTVGPGRRPARRRAGRQASADVRGHRSGPQEPAHANRAGDRPRRRHPQGDGGRPGFRRRRRDRCRRRPACEKRAGSWPGRTPARPKRA